MQIKYKNTNSITGLIVPVANIFQKHILNPILKTQPKVLKKEPFWKVELNSDIYLGCISNVKWVSEAFN